MKNEDAPGTDGMLQAETRRSAYETAAKAVVDAARPGTVVSVATSRIDALGRPALVLNVEMPGFVLRAFIDRHTAGRAPDADFERDLRLRMREAKVDGDRFAARLGDVRSKVEASLDRNGGMKLLSLEMAAYDIGEPFGWYDSRLEARIEFLGAMLVPEIETVSEFSARAMAGAFRSIGGRHQRRAKTIARLAAIGAAFEIDVEAERAIVACGRSVGDIADELRRRGTTQIATPSGDTTAISVMDGRIHLTSMFQHGSPRRPVMRNEVAFQPAQRTG